MSWEDSFQSWAEAPGETEQTKCDNAVRAIRKAIDASSALKSWSITVFPQGSYRNRTNVKADSDVDVCVLCSDSLFSDLPEGMADSDFGLKPADYVYSRYKNDVEAALGAYFGKDGVTRGNKAFDILEGVAFVPDKGTRIINWPEQNYENGIAKNKATGQRLKGIVRILKRLWNRMADEDNAAATPIPSFLMECLVWNVPNDRFGHNTYNADIRSALAYLFNQTMKVEDCKEWGEINDLKYLFHSSKPWTMEQAHQFMSAAWDYLGLE